MFFNLIPQPVRNFIDSIFAPPLKFLQMCIDYLSHVALVAGHGINLNNYFGFFSYLPGPMIAVVNSILAATVFLAVLQLVKAIMRLYFFVKEAVQWW